MSAAPLGPAIRIESLADPRVDEFRNLKDGELKRELGAFVVEGRTNVQALLACKRFPTRSIFVSETALASMHETWAGVPGEVPIYVAPQSVMNEVVGFHLHRGCLAVAERAEPLSLDEVAASGRILVAMEDLTNVDNVGSIFRNGLALGADGVILSPRCCDPLYRKAIRVSMGAALQLPFARAKQWPEDLHALRSAGFALIALDPGAASVELEAFIASGVPEKLVLVVGTEGAGLSPELLEAADVGLRIPMRPGSDSVNVATALAIALQRLVSALGAGGTA